MNYYRFLHDEIQIDFLTWAGNDKHIEKEIEKNGSKIYYMSKLTLMNFKRFTDEMNCFFINHQDEFHIVHSHFYQIDTIIAPIAKKYGVKKYISHSHSSRLSVDLIKGIRNRIFSLGITRISDVWAACSVTSGVTLFGKKFLSDPRSFLIKNAIKLGDLKPSVEIRNKYRQKMGFQGKVVLVHIGSFNKIKNQEFLIEVLNELIKLDGDKYILIFVGDGERRREIRKKVNELGLTQYVIFTGILKNVNNVLQASDIFVLPSRFEGVPLSAIEAQMAGKYCVLSDKIKENVAASKDCKYLSLNVDKWVECIKSYSCARPMMDVEKKLRKMGFDIRRESIRLSEMYIRIMAE